MSTPLRILFRGQKIEIEGLSSTTVGDIRQKVVEESNDESLRPENIKLILKGKVLAEDDDLLIDYLPQSQKIVTIIASGISQEEVVKMKEDQKTIIRSGPRIRDDLTEQGMRALNIRQRQAQQMMKAHNGIDTNEYIFGAIETLPNLPNREKAHQILHELANDPGVKACMAKHKWKVGVLAEMYPEGKVGQSPVCVMGLNQNKGQKILLRLRTDDLQGFRKIQSIRKVLYHELAHNVFSEHDNDFFQLMRQVERECTEMDWTHGQGLSTDPAFSGGAAFEGGTFRLGGHRDESRPLRDVLANAALQRMTEEEEEIQNNCGCGRKDLFLPKKRDE